VNQKAIESPQEAIRKKIGSQEEFRKLQENLRKAPDLVEFAQIQAMYEGLQEIIREKDKSIERLENDLNKAGQREEDLKKMHNNYFLQVQTLINQKAIGSHTGSTRKEESKPAASKEENMPAAEKKESPQNDLIEKICKNCNQVFYTGNIKKETCSSKCRSAFNRKMKKESSV